MPAQSDLYYPQYWRFADEFPDIYADDHAYALWHRLLQLGHQAWPTAATLPYGIRRSALDKLVGAGLIFTAPGGRFRVRGMDKMREARSEVGRAGAVARWSRAKRNANAMRTDSEGTADSNANAMPNIREEKIRKGSIEPTSTEPRAPSAPLPDADVERHLASLADVLASTGALPPKANGEQRKPKPLPDDEQLVAKYRAVLADESEPEWRREAAKAQLEVMGIQP